MSTEGDRRAIREAEYARVKSECERDPDFLWSVIEELRDLWKRALEREGNLASAVADVMWKATPFGEADDGDTFAYIVPKGAMHRLIGVAQSNGAHVPVAFRAAVPEPDELMQGSAKLPRNFEPGEQPKEDKE